MKKQSLFILALLSLSVFSSSQVLASDVYCKQKELRDAKTKEVVREFERADECVETLTFSVNKKYCESSSLKDLKTGATLQNFENEDACDEALLDKLSQN